MADPVNEETARNRWLVMNLLRLGGAGIVLIGMLIANRTFDAPEEAGYALLVIGLVSVFLVPQILARKWRSPDR
ncbi:hypothetical protein FHS61_000241 [Altererythrobacter atlanticus]|uniref:Uncharacterized protein n=1 Tax=Croceibacterium atlanticum TaxID=1267766 RepID=A0A0F7KTK3_9SPHN|nr:hypothetical protein [Croceibacterium atlanticum]AKH42471.1 hypothetical protein WYH_01430 [Croceibacterium atlanticum]MBB5731248.1 hypothetical protein [Croceibacterium atlanticum]